MRFYFDRHAQYRGFSTGPVFMIMAGIVAAGILLAFGRALFLLAPVIALWALVIWLARSEMKRWHKRREEKARAGQQ